MKVTLLKNKVTKNSIRFTEDKEDHPISIYLLKEVVAALGDPQSIAVDIQKES